MGEQHEKKPSLNIAIITVSNHRTQDNDTSGDYLQQAVELAGHRVSERSICPDNRYALRAIVSQAIASEHLQVVLVNGGTGFHEQNSTPEALIPLFDKEINGFGELFRMLSFEQIQQSTLQSRAIAGLANKTVIFAFPGSTSACQLAWEQIIDTQLDASTKPCNFVSQLKKVKE
ncbi:molybdenum cofactor biosynthesis protein B [Rosenbergiella australiborealis]|uniref:Molybdenum cofactor biosynthesis protein B n=1 Tax=Rosenbergiella australiborealis TaxID=1544696 RepID=A0ABS5T3W4_9GAMM|nr:molybdenum cofactor biosynthesis protein B [Rosenbergiella australiborealis]MBT0727016.1 molybdenum cofactor biosynthesis protein B [Rosenbergiella australiborealis]